MAELKYPGVYLSAIPPGFSQGRVRSLIEQFVKEGGKKAFIQKGGLVLDWLNNGKGNSNAVVKGINLSYQEIRELLKTKSFGKYNLVNLSDVDLGVERLPNGLRTPFNDYLHKHLKEGNGFYKEAMNIFAAEFITSSLGGSSKFESSLTIVEDKPNLNLKMDFLRAVNGFLCYENNHDSKSKLPGVIFHFTSKLAAVQGWVWLNGDPNFCKTPALFKCLFPDQVRVTPGRGLGRNGSMLDIDALMGRYKYIPFGEFDQDYLDLHKIHTTWRSRCYFCSHYYTLHGIHPDMGWCAATCKCPVKETCYSWPGEPFFRVTIGYMYARRHETLTPVSTLNNEPLMLLIKGLRALSSSTDEFRRSAYAAEKLEFQLQKYVLGSKFQIGTISEETILVTYGEEKKGDSHVDSLVNVMLDTPFTKSTWCKEGCKSIKEVCLIPKASNKVKGREPDLWDLNRIRGQGVNGYLQGITQLKDNPSMARVELTLWTGGKVCTEIGQEFYMIPEPPTSNIDAIAGALRNWRRFYNGRLKITYPQHVSIQSAVELKHYDEDYIKSRVTGETLKGWKVTFSISGNKAIDNFLDGIPSSKVHYGVEFRKPPKSGNSSYAHIMSETAISGVVTSVIPNPRIRNSAIVTAYMLSPADKPIIMDSTFNVSMWMGYYSDETMDSDIRQDMFFLKEEMVEFLDDDDDGPVPEDVMMGEAVGWLFRSGDMAILKSILDCPISRHVDLRDFLLDPSLPRVTHVREAFLSFSLPKSPTKISAFNFWEFLNPSQAAAVQGFLREILHLTLGPPGCGKTWTACIGLLALACLYTEEGIILCLAPTNWAADKFHQTLEEAMEKTGFRVIVKRMMAVKREEEKDDNEADRFLHSSILKDERFKRNKNVMDLLAKKREDERMILKPKDEKEIRDHTAYVRNAIMCSTQVVICTVGAAVDGRLATFFTKKELGSLRAIILDESNCETMGSMLPLLGLNPQKFWQVGDFYQLPPIISSRSAIMAAGDVCWMRMLTTTDYIKNSSSLTMLREQYRFPPQICNVVSDWMYKGELTTFWDLKRPADFYDEAFYNAFPTIKENRILRISYVAPFSVESKINDDSFSNEKECSIIQELVRKMVKVGGVKQEEIVILAMYKGQVTLLTTRISPDFPDVEILTSDSYEGQEQNIVIVSMTRHNERRDIGFLRESCRTNVALSRPKHYLFFISSEETFVNSRIKPMTALYEVMKKHGIPITWM